MNTKTQKAARRKKRVRGSIIGTAEKPRLSVYRSNAAIYVQFIDDTKGKTLFGISEKHIEGKDVKMPKSEKAKQIGLLAAKKALSAKITTVVFDRGSYAYHGRVKAVAEGAREGGLVF